MRKKTLRFLVALSKDPLKREAFQRNPEALLESAGITDEKAKAVLGSGDSDAVRKYLGGDEAPDSDVLVLVLS